MRRFVTIVLLLVLSSVSPLAARDVAKAPKRDHWQKYVPVKKPPPAAFDYRRGNSNWPYGPGYNIPYPDRPYGDPGHGGE
jgi:hypothetical protein